MEPTLFTIRISDAILADLRERLDRVRWPDEIPGADWQYGTDLTYLRQLVEYWRTQYDWRVRGTPQCFPAVYRAPVGSRYTSSISRALAPPPPLLLLHGWPGSVWNF
jgi:microsomal epoxide hydrolase